MPGSAKVNCRPESAQSFARRSASVPEWAEKQVAAGRTIAIHRQPVKAIWPASRHVASLQGLGITGCIVALG
jgi:hypothetical protein